MFPIRHIVTALALVLFSIINTQAQQKIVYEYQIHDEIGPAMDRLTKSAIDEAEKQHAAYVLIDMDTYGGLIDAADHIRTALLKTPIPTIVFIRNNAASAGALISIACDSIYMSPGSTIGAASVVNQQGELMPEKYQSYMRKKMRATAEETHRNPLIAEGMTDENLEIDSIKPKGKIVTFSVSEAIKYGYCNGEVNSPEEILPKLSGGPYVIVKHHISVIEALALWLINPAVSGVLLLLIFGGIYFEFKAPGAFFPIGVSIAAALLYFAPLYLEGLAANWEIVMFIIGLVLVIVEIFVTPGSVVIGVLGILFTISGLALALVRNINFDFTFVPKGAVGYAFLMVAVAMAIPLILIIAFGKKLFDSALFHKMSAVAEMKTTEGFSIKENSLQQLTGATGTALTNLRPAGRVEINNEQYDCITDGGFIEKGNTVKVLRVQAKYLVVTKTG
ncbi:MAG TPA: NfeD family protein [Chitinophagales bacterium]|nr:NfeD family protein [Chitinophagales bacterium]